MHRIGLHGKSVIPFTLGYGCSVPAVMATRILEFPQHRFIVSILTTIPCAARITIIFAPVAFHIGLNAALEIFAVNLSQDSFYSETVSIICFVAATYLILFAFASECTTH